MKSLAAEEDASSRKLLQTFLSRYSGCDIAVDGKEAVNDPTRLNRRRNSSKLKVGRKSARRNSYAAIVTSRPLKTTVAETIRLDHRDGLIVEPRTSHLRECPVIFTHAAKPRFQGGYAR
jgi:hypothetical protein